MGTVGVCADAWIDNVHRLVVTNNQDRTCVWKQREIKTTLTKLGFWFITYKVDRTPTEKQIKRDLVRFISLMLSPYVLSAFVSTILLDLCLC